MKEKKLNIFYTADFFFYRNNENAAPLWSGGEASAPFKRSAGAPSVSDMHPKKVTVLKVTGVELVTFFNLRFSCNTAYSFYCNRLSDRIYFSVP
ncbi:MAG: hypothetical protein IJ207_10135, partial [Treponema sp.]|uniref:hypothetical protein n=1 Tax=Treponema sp. TaxID=166 RepID=UPI0025D6D841